MAKLNIGRSVAWLRWLVLINAIASHADVNQQLKTNTVLALPALLHTPTMYLYSPNYEFCGTLHRHFKSTTQLGGMECLPDTSCMQLVPFVHHMQCAAWVSS